MILFLKRAFYSVLAFGVVASFCLRCASQSKVEEPSIASPGQETSQAPQPIQSLTHDASANTAPPKVDGSEFKSRTEQILKALPTNDVIKANHLGEDHHETPKAITASGRLMGEVMDSMLAHSENVPAGLNFYSKCAADQDVVLQVKALCLRNLRDWQGRLGKTDKKRFAKDVEKLAARLPKTRFQ